MPYVNSLNKIPISVHTGLKIDHLDPQNHLTYTTAKSADGVDVSRVLVGDGVYLFDLDKCIDSHGVVNQVATDTLQRAINYPVYIEVSKSGKGFHVWGFTSELMPHKCKNSHLDIELYTNDRHGVLTTAAPISPLNCITDVGNSADSAELFKWLVSNYFSGGGPTTLNTINVWSNDDNGAKWSDIKRRAVYTASNPFSTHRSLEQLEQLERVEWDQCDKSMVDMSLLNHLAFNAGGSPGAMYRLYTESTIGAFRASEVPCKLGRDCGVDDNGSTVSYLQRSILRAIADCTEYYKTPSEFKAEKQAERVEEIKAMVEGERGEPDSPAGYYLRDFVCMYAGDSPKYICGRTGSTLGKTTFKDCFKIDSFEFEQAFPDRIVADHCYSPGDPVLFQRDGLHYLNTYRPGPTPTTPSLQTVELLDTYFNAICPEEKYRKWLKQWCAHIIRYPKVKILSAVILCGNDTGTGKSTLGVLLTRALGVHNVARLNNNTLKDQYNGWLTNNVLAISEELRAGNPHSERAQSIKESMKDWITTRNVPIREMYKSTSSSINTVNGFLFSTNNIDGVPVDADDRRIFAFRVEMNFLIKSLIASGGYTELNHNIDGGEIAGYLAGIELSDFNPNAFAPVTDAKREMIEMSKDDILTTLEQMIDDPDCTLIDDVVAYNALISRKLDKPPRLVNKFLKSLGYVNYVGKPYYIKNGKLPLDITHTCLHNRYLLITK